MFIKISFIVFCSIFLFNIALASQKNTFSNTAWNKSSQVIEKIIQHPFNQELKNGNLDKDKFGYYIEQDEIYLKDYARCLAIISTKLESPYNRVFLKYATEILKLEQDQLHTYFIKNLDLKETGKIAPSMFAYTNYLLKTCSLEPVEVAVAAIIPCFWIYQEVALSLKQDSALNNIYTPWIETYSSKEYTDAVDEVLDIFNKLAAKSNNETREKMLQAFYTSSLLEWHFWNDAYYHRVMD